MGYPATLTAFKRQIEQHVSQHSRLCALGARVHVGLRFRCIKNACRLRDQRSVEVCGVGEVGGYPSAAQIYAQGPRSTRDGMVNAWIGGHIDWCAPGGMAGHCSAPCAAAAALRQLLTVRPSDVLIQHAFPSYTTPRTQPVSWPRLRLRLQLRLRLSTCMLGRRCPPSGQFTRITAAAFLHPAFLVCHHYYCSLCSIPCSNATWQCASTSEPAVPYHGECKLTQTIMCCTDGTGLVSPVLSSRLHVY